MAQFRVIATYYDRATERYVTPGDSPVTISDADTVGRLRQAGCIELIRGNQPERAVYPDAETATEDRAEIPEPISTGAGWYELPDGEKVRGEARAYEIWRERYEQN